MGTVCQFCRAPRLTPRGIAPVEREAWCPMSGSARAVEMRHAAALAACHRYQRPLAVAHAADPFALAALSLSRASIRGRNYGRVFASTWLSADTAPHHVACTRHACTLRVLVTVTTSRHPHRTLCIQAHFPEPFCGLASLPGGHEEQCPV